MLTRREALLGAAMQGLSRKYQVGAYYFPNYHVDPRNEVAHGKGWTEWELVKRAEPRFEGHRQPRKPLWGYEDEADPRVFARKIAAAADHGLTHFLWDWYWYEEQPFLNRCLEEGYLGAANRSRLQFALMWANHDWQDIQPAKLGAKPPLQYAGAMTRPVWERMTDYVVAKYFSQAEYWKLNGRPYFSVYELFRLVEGLGGVEKTRDALDSFRRKTRAAGHVDLHLNAVLWGVKILPGEQQVKDPAGLLAALGFDSTTSYVWIHHVPLRQFPVTEYAGVANEAAAHWRSVAASTRLPYYPNVTMGWDSSPRTCQSDRFENRGYPFMPVLESNTPEAFEAALRAVKEFLDRTPGQAPVMNINAWNEWTEGSYLEPDTVTGLGYLEAVKRVFGA
jgi:hypothetical protein